MGPWEPDPGRSAACRRLTNPGLNNTAHAAPALQLRRYLEEDHGRQAVLAEDAAAKRE